MREKGVFHVFEEIEVPLISIIERAQKKGVRIDVPYLAKISVERVQTEEVSVLTIWRTCSNVSCFTG